MNSYIVNGLQLKKDLLADSNRLFKKYGVKPKVALISVDHSTLARHNFELHSSAFQTAGIEVDQNLFAEASTEQTIIEHIRQLNADPSVDAILALAPMPHDISLVTLVNEIDPAKEVEGIHPEHGARLSPFSQLPVTRRPLTPVTLFTLLARSSVPLSGDMLVVLYDENVLEKNPVAKLAVKHNLVSAAPSGMSVHAIPFGHSRQIEICRMADVLLVSIEDAEVIDASWIKPGALCVDFNSIPVEKENGKIRIIGGIKNSSVSEVAGALCPIPGGFGPALLAMLARRILEVAFSNRGVLLQEPDSMIT